MTERIHPLRLFLSGDDLLAPAQGAKGKSDHE